MNANSGLHSRIEDGRSHAIANAESGTRPCGDGEPSVEVDSDCQTSDGEDANDDSTVSLKNTSEDRFREKDLTKGITKHQLRETKTQEQNDREMDESLASMREPELRDSGTINHHPLRAPHTRRPSPAPNPIAIAAGGATAATAGLPQYISDAFAQIDSYYSSMGTTLEAQLVTLHPKSQENAHLREIVQQNNKRINQLEFQIQKQNQEAQTMQQKIQQLELQLTSEGASWWNRLSRTHADCFKLKETVKYLEENLRIANGNYLRYKTGYQDLNDLYEIMQREKNEQGESIRQAQDAVFDIMKKSANYAETDDRIRSAIESDLLAPINEWTKDFVLSKDLAGDEFDEEDFRKFFSMIACEGVTPECLTRDSNLSQRQILRCLAKAFLSHFVMLKIFDSPFFLVKGMMNSGPVVNDISILGHLEVLRHHLIKANPKEGNKWRGQTVAAISELVTSREKSKGSHLRRICEADATEFENSGARFILEEKTEESHKALVAVFQKAGELALRLWRYQTNMGSVGPELLADTSFRYESLEMEAHISHKLDDNSMDGSKVALVIFPGIRADGNQEGERYGESKIWLKAQVRLTKPSSLTARPSVAEGKENQPVFPNRRLTPKKTNSSRHRR